MAARICIDLDNTVVDANEELIPGVADGLRMLKDRGYMLTLWSYTGEERARAMARKHNLCCFFDEYATKPDLAIDDDAETLSRLPVVDSLDGRPGGAFAHKPWSKLAEFAVQLTSELDDKQPWEALPGWLSDMGDVQKHRNDATAICCARAIWDQRHTYIRWPGQSRLLLKGAVRHPDGRRNDCYIYPDDLRDEITGAGLQVDARNNGPTIIAFLLAGGERPRRPYPETWGWSVHHIYDGQHPHPIFPDRVVSRAVNDGKLFTEAAGLVALHPVADHATSIPLLAWLLRWEAHRRFGFDPMAVF